MGMSLARRENESLVAIDLFDQRAGQEQGNADDDLDGQRLPMFSRNLLEISVDMGLTPRNPGGVKKYECSKKVVFANNCILLRTFSLTSPISKDIL